MNPFHMQANELNLRYPYERLYSLPVFVAPGSVVSELRQSQHCRASDPVVQSPLEKHKQAEYYAP